MGFFDRFIPGNSWPYTNLQQLNLDWIIKVCEMLDKEYPGMKEDINKKINKPLFNPDGSLNDVLCSDGNGGTIWRDFSETYTPAIAQAVNDWLTEHPEATTTVQDGSITIPKLHDTLKNTIVNMATRPPMMGVYDSINILKSTLMDEYASGSYSLEGVEYNSTRDRYVFCFTSETLAPILIETNSDYEYIRAIEIAAGGHVNDITYNARTDKYYIATMDTTTQVISLDATSLNDIQAVVLPSIPGAVSRIAYDYDNDRYFIYTNVEGINNYIYEINNDFTEKTLLMTGFYNKAIVNNYADTKQVIYNQGSTVYKGRFVCVVWYCFNHNPAITRLVFLNSENTDIDFYFDFQNANIYDEAETVINKNGLLEVPSYYDSNFIINKINTNGKPDENTLDIFRENLQKQTYTSETGTLLEDIGVSTDKNSKYKCWITFNTNPAGISGEQGILTGFHYSPHGAQAIIEPSHIYYRKLINNEWYGWHDILMVAREISTSILTEAVKPYTGGVQYLRYTGTDYSWLPFGDANFRYALFKIDYCFSQRIVTVIDTSNKIMARNMYVNNAWTGWYIEGIYSTTSNVLTLATSEKYGKYTIRYTGNDTTWLPGTSSDYIYGIFEIENISNTIIKVTAHKYNGAQMAINMYVNGAWQGWKLYNPTT